MFRQTSVLLVAILLAALVYFVLAADPGAKAATGVNFKNFELAATPPQPVGTTCPGAGDKCTNNAAEPAIRADRAGNFYASSENGLSAGTLAWKSVDDGLHYKTLPSPNAVSAGGEDVAPGGGDTDLAVAPQKNGSGNYNVYVASLSLANVTVSTSKDGGKTFSKNVTSATIPGDDREWIAADRTNKVCISYHDVSTDNIDVNCSYDAGAAFTQLGSAIDANHAYLIDNNQIGNLAIDSNNHNVYQVFNGVANASEAATSTTGETDYHAVWMGVSTDGGKTFRDHPVYISPNKQASFNHQFTNVSVDRAGNVYAFWSNDHSVFYSYSTDQGKSWSSVEKINSSPANTAIFPWSSAGSGGKVDAVYYGTSYEGNPQTAPDSAEWHVYMAQIQGAATSNSTVTQYRASPINHRGGVCEGGISCTGNRDLYDDFGVAASPKTGLASIVYSDDQPGNNGQDDHTAIATQTSGPGIFGP